MTNSTMPTLLPSSLCRPAPLLLVALLEAVPLSAQAPHAASSTCWPALPDGWAGVLLVSEQGRVASRADGANTNGPLTTTMRFNIASLGKMFTAVAIGQLADAGRLSLDDSVGRHLPELPAAFRSLTVSQLLSHTAGLGDYLSEGSPEALAKARSATDLLPIVLATPPAGIGTWDYSNSGYALAGAIVERLTGQTLPAHLASEVFARAGMQRIGFAPAEADALPTQVGADARPFHPRAGLLPAGPAGGHYASADDLARFGDALLAGRLVTMTTLAQMSSIVVEHQPARDDGVRRGWGLGFSVTGAGASRTFGHAGGVPGGGAALRLLPARGRVAIALASQDSVPAAPLSGTLLQADLARCRDAAGS